MTKLERRLIIALAEMVAQNCYESPDGIFDSGFIGSHKDAMQLLVELGVMKLVKDGTFRGYWAAFCIPGEPTISIPDRRIAGEPGARGRRAVTREGEAATERGLSESS